MVRNLAGKRCVLTLLIASFIVFFALDAPGAVASTTPLLFLPPVAYGSGELGAVAMAAADINAAGKADVVVVNICDQVGLLLRHGRGNSSTQCRAPGEALR